MIQDRNIIVEEYIIVCTVKITDNTVFAETDSLSCYLPEGPSPYEVDEHLLVVENEDELAFIYDINDGGFIEKDEAALTIFCSVCSSHSPEKRDIEDIKALKAVYYRSPLGTDTVHETPDQYGNSIHYACSDCREALQEKVLRAMRESDVTPTLISHLL